MPSDPISRIQALDPYLQSALDAWGHPGLAIAAVKDDQVIFARGYGVRQVGRPELVDENTVFGIGSASKAFTAAAVGILVDQGKLDWDEPALHYLPGFRLSDPVVTHQVTLRDLLCHRTGLPRGVRMLLRAGYSLDTYLERMSHVPLLYPFRSTFHYTNTTFDIAGRAVEAASGMPWGDFIQQHIFNPLGMTTASTQASAVQGVANRAEPHAMIGRELRSMPWRDIGQDPAGSINASMLDMAQWVRMMLNRGSFAGQTILSPASWGQITTSQMAIAYPERTDVGILQMLGADINFWSYGFGWFVQDYRGKKFVWHGGQINGFSAMIAILPGENFGFALVTNVHETMLHGALMLAMLDAYLGVEEHDWNAHTLQALGAFLAKEAEQAAAVEAARVAGTAPSLPLEAYAGDYWDDWWGALKLSLEGDQLVVHFGGAPKGRLSHWHYDTFRLAWDDPLETPEYATFSLDARGCVARLEIEGATSFGRVG